MTMSSLKKKKESSQQIVPSQTISHPDASLNHAKNTCSTCQKSCYDCNNRVLTNRAFNKVWKNMPSLICNVLPKARLEAMQVSDKNRPMCGAKGLSPSHTGYRDV